MKTLKRVLSYVRAVAPDAARTPLDPLYAYRWRSAERFMLMIGYNRSGTSLLGQLLNAHPEIVVAHELFILPKLRALRFIPTPSWRGRVARLIAEKDRQAERQNYIFKPGYSYAVNGLWQGERSRPRVIGDKGSTSAADALGTRGMEPLKTLSRRARLPARVLITVRNPYDVTASRRLNRLRNAGADIPPPRDYAPPDPERARVLEEDVDWLMDLSENISRCLAELPKDGALPTRYEEFIASPKENLRRICAFLEVDADEDYLDACAAFTLPTPSRTRHKVRWTDGQRERIAAAIAKHPWLAGYDFDG